jgi:hypothetical protein
VSDSKVKKYRYWLTYLLDDLPVGAKFQPSKPHLTFINWFVVDIPEDKLIESFYKNFDGRSAFSATIGSDLYLGPRDEVSVIAVEPVPAILELHAEGLNWLEKIEARWAVKNPYNGDEFIPHIRRREDITLKPGDILKVNSLSLIKAIRRPDDGREVAAKVLFGEEQT